MAGIKHENLVGLAVTVPVVIRKIHLVVNHPAGFLNHFVGMRVLLLVAKQLVILRRSVVGRIVGQAHRADNIKVKLEGPAALRQEIIAHTAAETILRIIPLVGNIVVELTGMASLKIIVTELSEDYQAPFLARKHLGRTARLVQRGPALFEPDVPVGPAGITIVTANGITSHFPVRARLGLRIGTALSVDIISIEFITPQLSHNRLAVFQRQLFPDTGTGRNSHQRHYAKLNES